MAIRGFQPGASVSILVPCFQWQRQRNQLRELGRTLAMNTRIQTSLPTWPARITSELDAADRRAQDLASTLHLVQLNWRPRHDAWSIGQCLQHLVLFNELYLQAISTSLKGQRSGGAEICPGWFGRWFIRSYVEPVPNGKRAQAPKKVRPGEEVDAHILEFFLRSNQQARAIIRKASDYDVNRIRFKNPLVPVLHFTVGTGLEIVWQHESRHLLQAERVRQMPAFPPK
jgi:DinB superfamily